MASDSPSSSDLTPESLRVPVGFSSVVYYSGQLLLCATVWMCDALCATVQTQLFRSTLVAIV